MSLSVLATISSHRNLATSVFDLTLSFIEKSKRIQSIRKVRRSNNSALVAWGSCTLSWLTNCSKANSQLIHSATTNTSKLSRVSDHERAQHCTPPLHKLHWLPITQRIKCREFCRLFQSDSVYCSQGPPAEKTGRGSLLNRSPRRPNRSRD